MVSDDLLTKEFQFIKFPKPTKEDRRDAGWAKKRRISRKTLKFALPKTKSRGKLIKELDKCFSDYMKAKSNGKCSRCGWIRKNAGVSHYWSRKHIGTRWEIDNCDWLCWLPCHQTFEHEKQGEYMDFMLKKLGRAKMAKLKMRANTVTKFSTVDIMLMIKNFDKIWL